MDASFWSVLGLGLLLGFRHSLDADHVVAVSTVAARTEGVLKAGFIGVFWGLGHTFTMLVTGALVLLLNITIPESMDVYFDWLVAGLLIYLGIKALIPEKPAAQGYEGCLMEKKFRRRSFFIGMAHGLAGSGALMLLMLSQVNSITAGFLYLILFGVGSVVGMFSVALLIGLPVKAIGANQLVQRGIVVFVAMLSVVYGIYLFIGI